MATYPIWNIQSNYLRKIKFKYLWKWFSNY
jgi:hypothetical protein